MSNKYRPARPDDEKKKGDEFNVGKWKHEKNDRWVKATMPNGLIFGAWHEYYRVLIVEEKE